MDNKKRIDEILTALKEKTEQAKEVSKSLDKVKRKFWGVDSKRDEAYKQGVEDMRAAAIRACHPELRSMISRTQIAEAIRQIQLPEKEE